MKRMEIIPDGTVTAPAGFRAGGIHCGIKKDGKTLDLCLLVSDRECSVAGVYTQNKVRAAPILVCEDHARDGQARAVVINSGCANACTGEQGLADAYEMTRLVGQQLDIPASDVMVASTGVIGVHLPMARIRHGVSAITLSSDGGHDAARAIMTTDTRPKESCARLSVGGRTVTIGGMAKGSGMIHPNMAT
ncbi:MAG TPA: bifunctional ornithine acetyltransferase/N-acetylglutamate synthase, partial [Chloroflexota bacterium]|nr:bifunctional ornithine acetyltransferase/N-acetylglutamate synthase [Chloroflexota bacterium]